mmetsp:Transcript_78312/g.254368  ORF Transcript_78312/g.254368 Transcript_78312/m.254368 type:complete len:220 (+) Transcript_78312:1070-1729(+)
MANFFAPAKDDRKTTSATNTAPGMSSLTRCMSAMVTGAAKLGRPEGMLPTTVMRRASSSRWALNHLQKQAVEMSRINSLKSLSGLRNQIGLKRFAFMRKPSATTLITNVLTFRRSMLLKWWMTMYTMPPLEAQGGRPSSGASCDRMMSNALAVMKPLSAGRERKRTRKASLHTPMRNMNRPTSNVRMAPTRVRYSMSSPYFINCSPVSRLTRPPVPTEA